MALNSTLGTGQSATIQNLGSADVGAWPIKRRCSLRILLDSSVWGI